jgi:3-oxoadipate enol-lactonase
MTTISGTARSSGVMINYQSTGEGPAVIFGHGVLNNLRIFDAQLADLSRDHRVIRFDFRGHGGSSLPRRWRMEDLADDYRAVMDAMAIESAVVAGFSMGGMAALQLALRSPERVRGLVLIDSSGGREPIRKRLRYVLLGALYHLPIVRPRLHEAAARLTFSPRFRLQHRECVESWKEGISRMHPRAVIKAARMVALRKDMTADVSKIEQPALILIGDEDETTPRAEAERLLKALPNAQLQLIPSSGHATLVEQHQQVNEAIRRFIAALPPQ